MGPGGGKRPPARRAPRPRASQPAAAQAQARPPHTPPWGHARTNQPTATAPPRPKLIDAERSQIQPAIGISPRILPSARLPLSLLPRSGSTAAAFAGPVAVAPPPARLPGPTRPLPPPPPLSGDPTPRTAPVQGRREECSAVGCPAMDRGERLGRALDAFGGDLWALVDAALDAAARDRPDELRARRDGIVERLYAAAGGCSNCARRPPPVAALAAAGLDEEVGEEAAPASPEAEAEADAQAGGAEEQAAEELGAGEPGLESKIVTIRDFLEDPNQPEDELVRLLQNLADMDVTYEALQGTDIGRQVNGLRKHPSAEVRRLVKQLIRKWKEIVNDWVRLHNSGGDGSATVMTADGDSPDKIQGRSHQSPRVSAFQYSPSPQRHNGSASERANNGFESTMDAKRRASPAPAHHNSRQMNNNHNSTTTTSSAPAKVTRERRQSLLDLDKLDSARKRLQENYQEAQNAKKQRTIQVMDINDIPKPKSRNAFIRKSGSGGLPARHR